MTKIRAARIFAVLAALAAPPAAAQVVGDWNAFEISEAATPPGATSPGTGRAAGQHPLKGAVITINGKAIAIEGVLPPGATKATLVGPGGRRLEIVKVGPNQWQTSGGTLPGLYHYRVVTIDEAGAGPKTTPGALTDLPGVPQRNPGPPNKAKHLMVAPGPPDKAKRLMVAPGPPERAGDPALGGPDIKQRSGSAGDGKFIIKKVPGRGK